MRIRIRLRMERNKITTSTSKPYQNNLETLNSVLLCTDLTYYGILVLPILPSMRGLAHSRSSTFRILPDAVVGQLSGKPCVSPNHQTQSGDD
jgi:hypothetical protein